MSRESANFTYVPLVKQEGKKTFTAESEDLYKVIHREGANVEIASLDDVVQKERDGVIDGYSIGQLSRNTNAANGKAATSNGRTGTRPGPLSASVAATSNGYGQKVSRELPHPQARSQPQPPVANMAHMTLLEHEIPTSLTFSKIYGFCEFLNGRYIRQKNHKHNDKPTYRSEFRAPTEAGPAGGNYVFLFYHQRNSAWVLGLMISESSGAAAYRKGNEPVPNMPSNQYWAVSNKQGKFEALAGVTCVAGYDGSMVQAEVASAMPRSPLEPSTLVHPTGTSRTDAQKMLFSEASNHDGGHGAFVLRESTSVPDSFVLSVLLPQSRIEHILIKAEKGGGYNLNGASFRTLRQLVEHHEINPLQVGEDANPESVKLRKCVSGQNIYMSLTDLNR